MNVDARWLTIVDEFDKVRPSKDWGQKVTKKADKLTLFDRFELGLALGGMGLLTLLTFQILVI